jgi:mannose-6-phosphate isomerase-like protein (cupin superfamily)
MRSTVDNALNQLAANPDTLFAKMMEHGSMSVEIYRPAGTDKQTPHTQDELYVIISGNGDFYNNGDRSPFRPGDILFVAAGHEHRFENFTDDFATWVIFYGPAGGER